MRLPRLRRPRPPLPSVLPEPTTLAKLLSWKPPPPVTTVVVRTDADDLEPGQTLRQVVMARRRAGKLPPRRQPPARVSPEARIRDWTSKINRLMAKLRRDLLEPLIDELLDELEQQQRQDAAPWVSMADGSRVRLDATPPASIRRRFRQIEVEFAKRLAPAAGKWPEQMAQAMNVHSKQQTARHLMALIGVNVETSEPWLKPLVESFSDRNANLITTIATQHLGEVQGLILEGYRTGRDRNAIARDIQRRGGVSERRARFQVRDQMNKLYGQVDERRAKGLGIRKAKWITMRDVLVVGNPGGKYPKPTRGHGNHWERHGKIYDINKPPADGRPGEAYGCRCQWQYIIPGLEDLQAEPTQVEHVGPPPRRRRRRGRRKPARPNRTATERVNDQIAALKPGDVPRGAVRARLGTRVEVRGERSRRVEVQTRWAGNMVQPAERPGPGKRITPPDFDGVIPETATDEEIAGFVQWQWIHGNDRISGVATKQAVAEVFDRNEVVWNGIGVPLNRDMVDGLKRGVSSMYNRTQAALAKQGLKPTDTVRLVRLVVIPQGEAYIPGALESFGTSAKRARNAGTAMASQMGITGRRVLMTVEVPRDRVLAYQDGPGWVDGRYGNQGEWLVIGGAKPEEIVDLVEL